MKWRSRCYHDSILFITVLLLQQCMAPTSATDGDKSDDPFERFLLACSSGNLQVVEIMLEEHADFNTGQSQQGESCLHAAGILGQTAVTKAVLQHGGNPNQRSTFEHGLRMTPLSWNVYGGHLETARALLEAGADVNMDFDQTTSDGLEQVTVLDLVAQRLPDESEPDTKSDYYQKQIAMRKLLLQYGAKQYTDLSGSINGEL